MKGKEEGSRGDESCYREKSWRMLPAFFAKKDKKLRQTRDPLRLTTYLMISRDSKWLQVLYTIKGYFDRSSFPTDASDRIRGRPEPADRSCLLAAIPILAFCNSGCLDS